MAKNCPKWQNIVQKLSKMAINCQNGQNPTGIKLILPGKTEPEVHQLTPSKLAPLNPPFPLALNVKHQLHFQIPKRSPL